MELNSERIRLHLARFSYDTGRYLFKERLEDLYGVSLGKLSNFLGAYPPVKRSTDQTTLAHKVFYSNFNRFLKPVYDTFVHNEIAPICCEPFYYQVVPTLRIGLPGQKFVGEFHKDSQYNHQYYEVNFNVGLINYSGTASLVIKTSDNSSIKIGCEYGEFFSFDHINCYHGSEINETQTTMVSFDFRIAIKRLYFDSDLKSVNTLTRFTTGHYFSDTFVDGMCC